MTTTLYYTVEKQLQDTGNDIEETTGWKMICVFEIVNDRQKNWFEIEVSNASSSVGAIEEWLKNNGFGGRKYEFEQL